MSGDAFWVPFPLGYFVVALGSGGRVRGVSFVQRRPAREVPPPSVHPLARGVSDYLQGVSRRLEGEIEFPECSPFTRAVWEAVRGIPYGWTATYGRIAAEAGFPGAARAVGGAMARNPVPLFIPCHRVVAATGLGGFGAGTAVKRWLLSLEGLDLEGPSSACPVGQG